MRIAAFFSTIAATSVLAFAAQAAPLAPVAEVNVTIGAELQDKADQYGQRELDYLARDLRESVIQAINRRGGLVPSGGTLDLVIEDAVPNRPTMRQMSKTPGLSFESFGIGGARVSGVLKTADGQTLPVSYRWYESDIRWSISAGTWSDAQTTFDRFGRRLADGSLVSER